MTDQNEFTLGKRLKMLREARGFTLGGLAKKVGCVKSYVWELESGNIRNPSCGKVSALAIALGVPVSYLLSGAATTRRDSLERATEIIRIARGLISAYYPALCDEEGYGPSSLLHSMDRWLANRDKETGGGDK